MKKTYTLKSVARRGSMLGAAFAIVAASFVPAASSFADALNPLTERSLTLSSSSPGWSNKDASGNATYAQPNSGANGEKTGNTFSFRVSSSDDVEAMTFQYCTTSAGDCVGPGNNDGDAGTRAANGPTMYDQQKSDLEIVVNSPTQISSADYLAGFDVNAGQPLDATSVPSADGSNGNFIVLTKSTAGADWAHSDGWAMAASSVQDTGGDPTTNKANFITLTNATDPDAMDLAAGDYVKVIFFGTDDNYITNPGAGAFFVKINTYNDDTAQTEATLIDGGVTVANVMNRSIEIQTKVLETMQFSVGTVDPNTLDSTDDSYEVGLSELEAATGRTVHTPCTPIAQSLDSDADSTNILKLGSETGEFSLATDVTYSTHSYWRLSSNSSAGATVYYSGVTLSNTVGDQIDPINQGTGNPQAPAPGSEQFGLALANGTIADDDLNLNPLDEDRFQVDYATESQTGFAYEYGEDNNVTGIHTASLTADNVISNGSWHEPRLYPLAPMAGYDQGAGTVNLTQGDVYGASINTQFAFDQESNLVPAPFATGTEVVDCVTGKMRYIANIAATTPAGIYTTKINYIAAPKY